MLYCLEVLEKHSFIIVEYSDFRGIFLYNSEYYESIPIIWRYVLNAFIRKLSAMFLKIAYKSGINFYK